jgi:hypothetical protein
MDERPYFLWDVKITDAELRQRLRAAELTS